MLVPDRMHPPMFFYTGGPLAEARHASRSIVPAAKI